ncbi:hypothetical protein [Hyalangium rubrum]|uniref:Lipoprotein n=1 Tax=Hyalangium rubrum TaxID=3103134 RepID=A0ABU5H5E3_9BACT|nr:hypothetical protein [Hyalangium sp. s54d21]MDY7228711.1 hypothetical protein [Hyalangium sp. s54d21]
MKLHWKRGLLVVLLALGAGCRGGGSGEVAEALINSTIAVASSGVSRAQGGCYAACPPGTHCDPNTGYCVTLPCRGQCKAHEQCVEEGLQSKCVALSLPGGNVTIEPPTQEAKNEP